MEASDVYIQVVFRTRVIDVSLGYQHGCLLVHSSAGGPSCFDGYGAAGFTSADLRFSGLLQWN